jgi:hypothetical protein
MPVPVAGAFLLALLAGMLVSLYLISRWSKFLLWFVLPLGLAAVISEWAAGWMRPEWRTWALPVALALTGIGLIFAMVRHYSEYDGLSLPVSAGVLSAIYLLTADVVDLGTGAWRPWATGIGVTLVVIGTLVDLFHVHEKYDSAGRTTWLVIGLLGGVGLAAAFAARGSWTPVVFTLSTLLLTTSIARLPVARPGRAQPAEPVSPRQLTANALGGFALVATTTVAMISWHVPVWLGFLLAVPDILGAAIILPPLVVAVFNRPRVRTRDALFDAGTNWAFAAVGTYLIVLIAVGTLWAWLDFVLGAVAAASYLIALVTMKSTRGTPSAAATAEEVPEPGPEPEPVATPPVFVPPVPVAPRIVSAEFAPGGKVLAGRLDRLSDRPERVYRLLLRAQDEAK